MALGNTKTATPSMWDLLTGEDTDAARRWFRWHPSQIDACLEARAKAMPDPLEPGELEELRSAHERWGADTASTENIARLGDSGARVIIAGQQLGVLGGPLFSIYKALGAISLAEKLGASHPDLNFIPVFWVAAEDHDFAEVAEAAWISKDGTLKRLNLEHESWSPGRMVGPLECESAGRELLSLAEASTFDTEFKPQVMALLERVYAEGRNWEDAFCEILLELTRGLGIVIVSPLMGWVRRRGASVLVDEAIQAGKTSSAVLGRARELEESGLTPALHRHEGSINFFAIDESGRRMPLKLEGDRVVAVPPSGGATSESADGGQGEGSLEQSAPRRTIEFAQSAKELADKVRSAPEEFSFNVVTRPMVQDSALPTVVQMVGPGEAAYFSQVEAAYETLGRFAAVRFPRPRVVLIAPNVERAMKKQNITLDEVLGEDVTAILDQRLAEMGEDEDAAELERLAQRQLGELEAIGKKIGNDPGIAKAIEKLSRSLERGFNGIADRLRDKRRKANGDLAQSLMKIQIALKPENRPQERVFNPLIPYAINHGLDWPCRLYPLLKVEASAELQPIYLSAISNRKEE